MRSQIASLHQAADNNTTAISLVQTAEGALNEVSTLLVDMRQRAVAAANIGLNDENMVNASQQEIENALDTIDRISTNTQFGSKNLLDGNGKAAAGVPTVEAEAAAEASEKNSKIFTFQIGAEEGQMVSIDLPSVATTELAKGVSNQSGFASLADVDVTTGQGAQDAMEVIDTAIEEIAVARGEMGAFQKNTLESNLTSLRIHTENLTAAESSIRDADIAVELAAFTRNQIMTQSATAQLAQANALPKNVMSLLASQ